jgi:hypothetical protein
MLEVSSPGFDAGRNGDGKLQNANQEMVLVGSFDDRQQVRNLVKDAPTRD